MAFDISIKEAKTAMDPEIKERLAKTAHCSSEKISEKLEKAEKQRLSASKDYSQINRRWTEKTLTMRKMFEDKTESLRIKFDTKLNMADERRSTHI